MSQTVHMNSFYTNKQTFKLGQNAHWSMTLTTGQQPHKLPTATS